MHKLSILALMMLGCRTDGGKSAIDTASVSASSVDFDGDGYDTTEDCDDANSTINPNAVELCDGFDNDCDGEIDEGVLNLFYQDLDMDGFGNPDESVEACVADEGYVNNGNDCNDNAATAYPSAPEQCDEIDNDCDGVVDEDLQTDWWIDEDGDGFGDPEYYAEGCLAEDGFAANSDDCDDMDAEINPEMEEVCDEVDNNCDGDVDEDLRIIVYVDADNDGFGDDDQPVDVCEFTEGFALVGGDCDDIDSSAFPGGVEVCDDIDNDCDGVVDDGVGSPGTVWYFDADGDGYGDDSITEIGCVADPGYVLLGGDCDDGDALNFPNNTEVCDGQDNNCDALVDDDDPLIVGQTTFYQDIDADGVGSSVSQDSCNQPTGFVGGTGDCDDLNNTVYPNAAEICDGLDNTCDGLVDDNDPNIIGQTVFYEDGDGDGVGSSVSQLACFLPTGYVANTGDCDDANTSVYLGAQEICDGFDNDCNGDADDDDAGIVGQVTFYQDLDGDGVGSQISTTTCVQPSGYVASSGDCNDADVLINPNATEVCDSIDNDCDGDVDDADSSIVGQNVFYQDADADGFGSQVSQTVCFQPTGYVATPGDCDDGSGAVNPNATEICDSIDNDCDNAIDDNDGSVTGQNTYYRDLDSDGFGNSSDSILSCSSVSGYVANSLDCDDGDSSEYPGVTWYADSDGDGFGSSSSSSSCSRNSGSDVQNANDCNDGNSSINPNATEVCDSIDNDCDNAVDDNDGSLSGGSTFYQDSDGDGFGSSVTTLACTQPSGFVTNSLDCNDGSSAIQPNAQEVCDGFDNDCDGAIDDNDGSVTGQSTFYRDADGDGYGTSSITTQSCSSVGGYVSNASDCDDGDSSEYPGVTWYSDSDGDGYGNASSSSSCSRNSGSDVQNAGDCNDSNGSVNPGAAEQCDLADNNCNNSVDEGVSCTQPIYRSFNSSTGQHRYSTSFSDAVAGGGSYEGVSFYLYTNYAPGLTMLYRCARSNGKTFLTTSSSCEGSGMYVDRYLGYISYSNISGTSGVYRSYYSTNDNHLYTKNYSEYLTSVANGYTAEGNIGYAW